MRIRSITPIRVSEAELERRRVRYRALAPDGVIVDLVNLSGDDAPSALSTAEDIATSERLVAAEARRTDPAAHDLVLPDCVLDPGVHLLEDAPVPAAGILQLSAGFLASLGRPFGAVTRNAVIAHEFRECLARYGLLPRCSDVAVLGLSFDDIEDDAVWNAALDDVRPRFAAHRTTTVINGCSAVDVRDREDVVAFVDPTALALRLLGVAAQSGLPTRTTVPTRP